MDHQTAAPTRGRADGVSSLVTALLSGLARSILLTLAALLLWAALPAAWGWVPTTVQSDSMAPLIRTGDVIVSMRADAADLKPGRDVLVHDPDHPGHLRLHRFVRFDDDGTLVTKGDANAEEDSSHVRGLDLVGIAVVRVPYIGAPIVWLNQGRVLPLAISAAGVLALLALARLGSPRKESAGRHGAAVVRSGRPALAAVAMTAIVVIAGAGVVYEVSTPASAGFFAASPNGASGFSAASTYDCLSPATADSPYLLYRFSEVSGTSATDSSGNGRTGTLQGTITREAGNCSPGSSPSIAMSGTTAYVSTPTSVASPNGISIEAWFRTTSTTGGRLMGFGNAQTGTSNNTDRQLYLSAAGKVLFGAAPGGTRTTVASPASYNDGAWHLATATLGTGGMRLSIDGTLVASNTGVTTGRSLTGYWRVGGDSLTGWTNAPTTTVLTGSIGSAAVYPTVLSSTQIQQHYATGQ